MNVFGKRERSWRKARKRGVSPIIATILLVAITVVLAAVLYVLISGLTKGPGTTPIGTAFGFGTAQQASNTNCAANTAGECYTVGVASASSQVTTASVSFAVQNGGAGVSAGAVVTLLDISGSPLAVYTVGTGWAASTGQTLPISFSSTQTLVLSTTSSVAGDTLVAAGTGSLQGTTSVALP